MLCMHLGLESCLMLCMKVLEPPSDMSSGIGLVGNHVGNHVTLHPESTVVQRNSRERTAG